MEQHTDLQPGPDALAEELSAWMQTWADRITQFAHSYTGNWAAAEDVTQEAFLRLYEHRRSGRPVHVGWLFTVAHNLAVDARRRPRSESLPDEVPDGSGPSDRALLVRDAVDRLPRVDQQVLWLFYYADYSMAETAATLGLSVTQVKARLHRARERFRRVWRTSDE